MTIIRRLTAVILLLIAHPSHASSLAYQQAIEAANNGNYAQAHAIFLNAAKEGDRWSQFGLGVIYLDGQGVSVDVNQSTQWFQKAANQGLSFAQFNLGNAYLHGRGVKANLTKAAFWWQQAAEQGNANAQGNLGTLMYVDYATEKSKRLGKAWLIIAANHGDDSARKRLAQINSTNDNAAINSIWTLDPELSEATILTMPSTHFSINLFSAKQKTSVENFLRQNSIKENAYIYRFPRGDSFLYGILYGSYPSRADAKETIKSMRPELRKHGPWSVALNKIQNKIHAIHIKQLQQDY